MSPQRLETHPKRCKKDTKKEPALKHQELTEEHTESWLEYLMHNELQCDSQLNFLALYCSHHRGLKLTPRDVKKMIQQSLY